MERLDLIDRKAVLKLIDEWKASYLNFNRDCIGEAIEEAIDKVWVIRCRIEGLFSVNAEPVRHGRWVYKHRHKGGLRRVTGVDDMGVQHTITIDERYEVEAPYCSECGSLAGDMQQDHCCVCKARMDAAL